ncbi:MAG: hypothetical protein PHH37_02345 [Paludibacter sp.]|nr:hypothetical protein [Paludibacter sp.]
MKINAGHVIWTKPYSCKGQTFNLNDAELLTMILSALMWQELHGPLKLYTDNEGLKYIKKHNLEGLWKAGIDTNILDTNSDSVQPDIFWAAGKLLVLEKISVPALIFDTDLIILQNISDLLKQENIITLHPENLSEVYLPPGLLKTPPNYLFPADYDWDTRPSNTAFLYINNTDFKNYYIRESKRFMLNNFERPKEMVSQMVFAEQRLLSMCAKKHNLNISYLLTEPFSSDNNRVIHLWGFKEKMRKYLSLQEFYISLLLEKTGYQFKGNQYFEKVLTEILKKSKYFF